jgi:hypothetical protein
VERYVHSMRDVDAGKGRLHARWVTDRKNNVIA